MLVEELKEMVRDLFFFHTCDSFNWSHGVERVDGKYTTLTSHRARDISIFAKPKRKARRSSLKGILWRRGPRNCIGSIQRPLLSPRELSIHLGGKMMAVTRKLPVPVIPRVIRIRAGARMVFAGHSTFFTPPQATC